jgi:hypothetical protein
MPARFGIPGFLLMPPSPWHPAQAITLLRVPLL